MYNLYLHGFFIWNIKTSIFFKFFRVDPSWPMKPGTRPLGRVNPRAGFNNYGRWCVVVLGCGVLGLYGGCLGEWLFSCKGRQLSLGFFRLGFFFFGRFGEKSVGKLFIAFLYLFFFISSFTWDNHLFIGKIIYLFLPNCLVPKQPKCFLVPHFLPFHLVIFSIYYILFFVFWFFWKIATSMLTQ